MNVLYADLISGANIAVEGIGNVRQPQLGDIFRSVGYSTFNSYLSVLLVEKEELNIPDELRAKLPPDITTFEILVSSQQTRDLLWKALSFFMCETLAIERDNSGFMVIGKDNNRVGKICSENFGLLQYTIRKICFMRCDETPSKKFKNARAREIYEKIQAGRRAKQEAQRANPDMEIPNIISALSAKSLSYNLLNIWQLTVYQLYDQFSRVCVNTQLDVMGVRWGAWGKEDFDFSVWYKNAEQQK